MSEAIVVVGQVIELDIPLVRVATQYEQGIWMQGLATPIVIGKTESDKFEKTGDLCAPRAYR